MVKNTKELDYWLQANLRVDAAPGRGQCAARALTGWRTVRVWWRGGGGCGTRGARGTRDACAATRAAKLGVKRHRRA